MKATACTNSMDWNLTDLTETGLDFSGLSGIASEEFVAGSLASSTATNSVSLDADQSTPSIELLLRCQIAERKGLQVHDREIPTAIFYKNSGKAAFLGPRLKRHAELGQRTVLFVEWSVNGSQLLIELCLSLRIPLHVITGDTPSVECFRIVKDFAAGKVLVLILHTDVGGEAITLTAARYCYIFTYSYVPSKIAQAIARLYRLGQACRVIVWIIQSGLSGELRKVS